MKVTAYLAKDKSLHLKQSDQIQRDIEIKDQSFTEHVSGIAKVCSQRTTNRHIAAASTPEDFREMLAYVFLHHRDMVDQILQDIDDATSLKAKLHRLKNEDSDDDADDED